MDNFWTTCVQGTTGGTGYQHDTLQSALTEAERLANMKNNIGKRVYVLECVGWFEIPKQPTNWHPIDRIPF